MHDDHHHDHADKDHHGHGQGSHSHHGHGHGHGHVGHHHHHHSKTANLKVALFLNLGFSILEFAGGIWTGSVAIMSDAIHDMGDALSLALALIFERLASKGSTSRFSYGYRRLSLLSALLTGAFLIVGSALVMTRAIPRLMNPVMPDLNGMLGFAVLGIAVNGYAAWRVMRGATMNERLVSWHLIEDVLGWVTVLVGTVVMKFWDVPILDPILSLLFSMFIVWNVIRSLAATVRLFLQASPTDIDIKALRAEIAQVPGVLSSHDAHLWSLDGESHVLTLHLVVAESATIEQMESIKTAVRGLAAQRGKIHATIEIESERTDCAAVECVQDIH